VKADLLVMYACASHKETQKAESHTFRSTNRTKNLLDSRSESDDRWGSGWVVWSPDSSCQRAGQAQPEKIPWRLYVSANERWDWKLEIAICDLKIWAWRPALTALRLHRARRRDVIDYSKEATNHDLHCTPPECDDV